MVVSLRRLLEWAKFLILFVLLTLLLYQVIGFLAEYTEPTKRYRTPTGRAVKVFAPFGVPEQTTLAQEWKERLFLFYWIGE